MQEPSLIHTFIAPLERAGLEYMISGSVATSLLGEPRFTADVDIALFLKPSQVEQFIKLFPDNEYYLPPIDVILTECRRETRGHFNIIHHATGLKADVYPSKNHPYLGWALQNKIRIEVVGVTVSVAPPEYVILHKLAFYQEGHQEKHIRDILSVCLARTVDQAFLSQATKELHLQNEWAEVTKRADEF